MSVLRILIAGFGRFPGATVNPSGLVAAHLAARRRPAFAGTRRVAHVFATRYDAVDRDPPHPLSDQTTLADPGIPVQHQRSARTRAHTRDQLIQRRALAAPAKQPPGNGG